LEKPKKHPAVFQRGDIKDGGNLLNKTHWDVAPFLMGGSKISFFSFPFFGPAASFC